MRSLRTSREQRSDVDERDGAKVVGGDLVRQRCPSRARLIDGALGQRLDARDVLAVDRDAMAVVALEDQEHGAVAAPSPHPEERQEAEGRQELALEPEDAEHVRRGPGYRREDPEREDGTHGVERDREAVFAEPELRHGQRGFARATVRCDAGTLRAPVEDLLDHAVAVG
jgi:hypothetical protein